MDNQRSITLRFLAEPRDINFAGKVHGGTVMRWIDQAGYACAVSWCKSYCVTIYVGGIRFYTPVHIGDLVEVQAKIIYTGNTSLHVAVDVMAGDPKQRDFRKTTHCIIVFVSVDDDGKPIPVPVWKPTSEEDVVLKNYAKKLMDLRKGIEEEMQKFLD